jgi:hypothetical protein
MSSRTGRNKWIRFSLGGTQCRSAWPRGVARPVADLTQSAFTLPSVFGRGLGGIFIGMAHRPFALAMIAGPNSHQVNVEMGVNKPFSNCDHLYTDWQNICFQFRSNRFISPGMFFISPDKRFILLVTSFRFRITCFMVFTFACIFNSLQRFWLFWRINAAFHGLP